METVQLDPAQLDLLLTWLLTLACCLACCIGFLSYELGAK